MARSMAPPSWKRLRKASLINRTYGCVALCNLLFEYGVDAVVVERKTSVDFRVHQSHLEIMEHVAEKHLAGCFEYRILPLHKWHKSISGVLIKQR